VTGDGRLGDLAAGVNVASSAGPLIRFGAAVHLRELAKLLRELADLLRELAEILGKIYSAAMPAKSDNGPIVSDFTHGLRVGCLPFCSHFFCIVVNIARVIGGRCSV